MADIESYSDTAASNVNEFPENQAPSTVNNGGRSFQAHVHQAHMRLHSDVVCAGTAAAITATFNTPHVDFVDGRVICVEALYDNNTLNPTFNLDGLGAKTIKRRGNQALQYGNIRSGMYIFLKYNLGNDVWELLNPAQPAGILQSRLSSTVPADELECDGSAVSRTTYAALFAAIGDTYGVGDGSTTFNLPDLRGQFLRGYDHGAGTDPDAASRTDSGDGTTTGDNVGTQQSWAIENITGSITNLKRAGDGTASVSTGAFSHTDIVFDGDGGESRPGLDLSFDASNVVQTSTETRPSNIAVMFTVTI